jgi:hypothetical protein
MNNLLRQVNETWRLHYRDALPRGAGCVAFVVDERCVRDEGIEFRLAVSFGDNIWPDSRPQGFLTPRPMSGRYCFGIHDVGTRGGRMALFDKWYDARAAQDGEDPSRAEAIARAVLASIPDEEYLRMIDPGVRESAPALTRSDLLPLDQYELVDNEETL